MQWIRDTYGVPAKRGGRVEYTGTNPPAHGTIVGTGYGHLRVRLDGQAVARLFHPTWRLRYLPRTDAGGEG
jgi:hypothetical protein